MKTNQKQSFNWWDSLTMGQKIFYGQMFPNISNNSDLIYKSYQAYLNTQRNKKPFLSIVE